jgi:hypothetical protein
MCPLHVGSAAGTSVPLPGRAQEAADLRDTFSALRLAVKATEQGRHRADAAGDLLADRPF